MRKEKKVSKNFLLVGLGNPDPEYKNTRHNVGWLALDFIAGDEWWEHSSNANAHFIQMSFGKHNVELLKPTTFMNKSGVAVAYALKKHKVKPENVVIIYDDLDLGLGDRKMSFNRGSGGHKGIESIARALKTKAFLRIRIGISPITPSGVVKKPKGEREVLKYIMNNFKPSEEKILKKVFKEINEVIDVWVEDGRARAMNLFN